jgi:hypothetical protein
MIAEDRRRSPMIVVDRWTRLRHELVASSVAPRDAISPDS